MRESWPHAPPHYFTPHGIYVITGATLDRKPLFDSDAKLDLFRDTTFEFGEDYALILQAWVSLPINTTTEPAHEIFIRSRRRIVSSFTNPCSRRR